MSSLNIEKDHGCLNDFQLSVSGTGTCFSTNTIWVKHWPILREMQVVGGEVGDEREDGETHFVVLHICVVIPNHTDSTALSMTS